MINEKLRRAKAFFFDLDGTLVDSEELHKLAYITILENDAPQLVEKFNYDELRGRTTKESLLFLGLDDRQATELTLKKQNAYRTFVSEGKLRTIPLMEEIFKMLSSRGDVYIVTGSARETVKKVLKNLGLTDFVKGIIAAEDVTNSKPHPEPYIIALNLSQKNADEAIVIEDSENGIKSATAAGIFTISIDEKYDHPLSMNLTPEELLEEIKKLISVCKQLQNEDK